MFRDPVKLFSKIASNWSEKEWNRNEKLLDSNIVDLPKPQTKSIGEFDGIFYELQMDKHIKETINILKNF